MKHILCIIFVLLCSTSSAFADAVHSSDVGQAGAALAPDDDAQLRLLAKWVQNARNFEREFTREKVYLHLDNSAYFEDETIWFKAYVVRASTLCPDSALSHVLYVDLLDSRGETIEQKLVHIDELGQGEGAFELKDPVRSGYYEIRAYTRALSNWGTEACFSRVVPVFKASLAQLMVRQGAQDGPLNLEVPIPDDDPNLVFGAQRPSVAKATSQRLVFFPEGGNRVGGVEQCIAYQLTDEQGRGLAQKVSIRRADGTVITESVANAEGMGRFTLPADIPATEPLYALTSDKRFTLPDAVPQAQYVLGVEKVRGNREEGRGNGVDMDDDEDEAYEIHIRSNADRQRLLGLLVSCRARPCYFDTIHVFAHDDIVMTLGVEVLRDGVNCIDLFDEDGHSLCRRLVWKQPEPDRNLNLSVRQNAATFDAFRPIALDLRLNNCEGYAVPDATFSVSVRNADADVVASPAVDLTTELLLSSELRGYIHHPEQYCAADTADLAAQRAVADAIDLLLLVQGWSAEDFETFAGAKPFNLQQPIENHLTLDGTVYRDNDTHTPYPGLDLHLQMYTREGASLEAYTTTDEHGRFAFESAADYCGEWIAQFVTDETTTNRRGQEVTKKRWSRIALNRWFEPKLRPFYSEELKLNKPAFGEATYSSRSGETGNDVLFEWTDTIQRVLINHNLGEAVAVHHNGYRGLVGNRYTYNGGEAAALRRPSFYINVGRENERRKDAGLGEGTIFDIISEAITRTLVFAQPISAGGGLVRGQADVPDGFQYVEEDGMRYMENPKTEVRFSHNAPVIEINNRPCVFFLNNELVGYGYGNSLVIEEGDMASEYKSIVIMPERQNWMRFWPVGRGTTCPAELNPYLDGKPYYGIFLYNRPDAFRYYTKKGVDKRIIQGYDVPRKFYTPQYNGIDEPTPDDFRRTLCWRPNVTTDNDGHASVVFYNDATDGQRITISVRGITADGNVISFDR